MRCTYLALFGALTLFAWQSPLAVAATEPQAGSYVVSGVVDSVSGGTACGKKGEALAGYSFWPGSKLHGNYFTIVIPPTASAAGAVFSFPQLSRFTGSVWRDTLTFGVPPSAVTKPERFSLAFTAYNATSFSILLRTTAGACANAYTFHFKLGLPSKLF